MKRLSLLALILALTASAQAFACDGEETPDANGMTSLSGLNLECQGDNGFWLTAEYSWGSCLTSQEIYLGGGAIKATSFINSARRMEPREDDMRSKALASDGRLITMRHSYSKHIGGVLTLARDAANDATGKDYDEREVQLRAYKGSFVRNGQSVSVSCRETAQQH